MVLVAIRVLIGMLVLAGVTTCWLIWKATKRRHARDWERRAQEASPIRAAFQEQFEHCRRWGSVDLSIRSGQLQQLDGWIPSFERLSSLSRSTALPLPLIAYLAWLKHTVQQDIVLARPEIERLLATATSGSYPVEDRRPEFSGQWALILDRFQTMASLLQAEAWRQELPEAVALFDTRWLAPVHGRVDQAETRDVAVGAPPFPSDRAYTHCSPAARNRRVRQSLTLQRLPAA